MTVLNCDQCGARRYEDDLIIVEHGRTQHFFCDTECADNHGRYKPVDALNSDVWEAAENDGIEPDGFEDWFCERLLYEPYAERDLTRVEQRTIDEGVDGYTDWWETGQQEARDIEETNEELSRGYHFI